MDKEEVKEYRKLYEELNGESEQEVDKYIRYLSGGALAISLTFIKDILPENDKPICISLIYIGWGLLIFSLFSNFVSYFFTISNTKKTIKEIDDEKENWVDNANRRNMPIKWINYSSSGLCIVGIILITLFVSLNINNMNKKITPPNPKTEVKKLNESKTLATPKTIVKTGVKTSINTSIVQKKNINK